tara:strand:- start:10094 stop:10948 length:855 start_codon:yes stop_codon:yes gene_type:complete
VKAQKKANGNETRSDGLIKPGHHGSLLDYMRKIWERREYLYQVPKHELRSQQMGTVLGNVWHLLNPILSIVVYAVIFGVILKVDRGVSNFVAFVAIGVFVFSFSQKSIITGSQSIVKNRTLIRSINFPRALLPITSVSTEFLAFLPGLAVMFATCIATGANPKLSWVIIPALILVQFIFNCGATLIAARATARYGDVKNILPFVFRLLFYGSGVLFSVDAYVTNELMRNLFVLNPMFNILELYRWAILGGSISSVELFALAAWTICLFYFGVFWFRKGESSYGA